MSTHTHCKHNLVKDNYCPFCHSYLGHCKKPNDPCDCYEYCDCCDVRPITSCLKKMENITDCVFECLKMRPTPYRELRVSFCILLAEISAINDKLDCIAQAIGQLTHPCCRSEKDQESN